MLIGGSLYRSEMEPWTSSWLAALEGIEENSRGQAARKEKCTKFASIPTETTFFSSKHFSSYLSLPGKDPRYNEMAASPLRCGPLAPCLEQIDIP